MQTLLVAPRDWSRIVDAHVDTAPLLIRFHHASYQRRKVDLPTDAPFTADVQGGDRAPMRVEDGIGVGRRRKNLGAEPGGPPPYPPPPGGKGRLSSWS